MPHTGCGDQVGPPRIRESLKGCTLKTSVVSMTNGMLQTLCLFPEHHSIELFLFTLGTEGLGVLHSVTPSSPAWQIGGLEEEIN